MRKLLVSLKKRSSRLGILPMILSMIGVMLIIIPVVENAKEVFYRIGEEGTRGSEVMVQFFAARTRVLCAGACSSAPGCLGFNWMPKGTPKCELLSSLRLVELSAISDLYVPDGLRRTFILLVFPCPNCMEPGPQANEFWHNRCEANAVVVGIASSSSFPNLDYLLCGFMEGLKLLLNNGYTSNRDKKGCNTLNVPDHVPDCLWGNDQYYNPADYLRYACRRITTGQKIDRMRCLNATETYGFTSGIPGLVTMYLCPPHMVAQRIYVTGSVGAYFTCCLLY